MTTEDAIRIMKRHKEAVKFTIQTADKLRVYGVFQNNTKYVDEAYDMAIKALESQIKPTFEQAKQFCRKQDNCLTCPFGENSYTPCYFEMTDIPREWDIEYISKCLKEVIK